MQETPPTASEARETGSLRRTGSAVTYPLGAGFNRSDPLARYRNQRGGRACRDHASSQLLSELKMAPLVLVGAGGLLYSVGAIIYASQRPNPWPRTFGFHEIFHVLMIAAAAAQYAAVLGWVLPAAHA